MSLFEDVRFKTALRLTRPGIGELEFDAFHDLMKGKMVIGARRALIRRCRDGRLERTWRGLPVF